MVAAIDNTLSPVRLQTVGFKLSWDALETSAARQNGAAGCAGFANEIPLGIRRDGAREDVDGAALVYQ